MEKMNIFSNIKDYIKEHFEGIKSEQELLKHKFFNKCLAAIIIDIPKIKLENKKKEIVSKRFLKIFYSTLYNELKHNIKNTNVNQLTNEEIKDKYVIDINELYETVFEEAREQKIPEIFIEKFATYHTESTRQIILTMNHIVDSKMFKHENNLTIVDRLLDIYLSKINFIIFDVEAVLSDLNGELDKIILKLDI